MPRRSVKTQDIEFGKFRVTKETLWRPERAKFQPRVETTPEILDATRRIERADAELERTVRVKWDLFEELRRNALIRNAFATASIEGNPMTLEEVESLLTKNPSPASANDPHEVEHLNYATFMRGPQSREAPRTAEDVRLVHRELMRDVLRDAGSFKSRPNFIGRRPDMIVTYVPTAPERVEREVQNAVEWLQDERGVHPLVRAIVYHHEFESIHPFRDGNGRTGRAIIQMALRQFGYPGVELAQVDFEILRSKSEYYEHLVQAEREGFEDYTQWAAFMLSIVQRAYEHALQRALFERELPSDLPARQLGIARWFARLEAESRGRRVKFNDVHHAFPEIPDRTLKRDLADLRDGGVLDAQGERKGTTYGIKRTE